MGYQGNKGNLPEKEEQTKAATSDRNGDAEDVRSNNAKPSREVVDNPTDHEGTRDSETDTLGNP